MRQRKYKAIKKFCSNKINYSFWKSIVHELQYVKTKFTCSEDYTVAFLDIFNYKTQHSDLG